jgi:hypothetical protein
MFADDPSPSSALWLARYRVADYASRSGLRDRDPGARAAGYDWPQYMEGDWSGSHGGVNSQETTIGLSTVSGLTQSFQVSLPSVADGEPDR